MEIRAGYGRVLVRPCRALEDQSSGGIMISQTVNALDVGEVVSVGHPDDKFGVDDACDLPFGVGDRVLYAQETLVATRGGKTLGKPLTRDVVVGGTRFVSVLQLEVVAVLPPVGETR